MHLSILSECFAADSRCAAGSYPKTTPSHGHFDSLIRGMVLLCVAGLLIGMTLLADVSRQAQAEAAPRIATSAEGSAVNIMHREVIGH